MMSIWLKLFGKKSSPPEDDLPYSLAAVVVTGPETGQDVAEVARISGKSVMYLTTGRNTEKTARMANRLSHEFADDPSLVFIALVKNRVRDEVVSLHGWFVLTDPHRSLQALKLQSGAVLIASWFVLRYLDGRIPIGALLMNIVEPVEKLGLEYRFEPIR